MSPKIKPESYEELIFFEGFFRCLALNQLEHIIDKEHSSLLFSLFKEILKDMDDCHYCTSNFGIPLRECETTDYNKSTGITVGLKIGQLM